MQLNADEADYIARILMLASASAVPHARWIDNIEQPVRSLNVQLHSI